ncbi:septum formation protein Maf [Escherichia coli P0298942.12]|nr:septum formation protein Maf [Escherichia coli P0298942.12]
MTSLYLASGSPRRQELLAQLGVTFERIVTGIEEQRQPQESAQQYVVRLAREKAQAGVAQTAQDLPVLGADTIVILNGEVLEKPRDAEHAAQMLRKLSGQTHQVMTAVALAGQPAHSRLPGGHRCDFQNVNRRRHRGLCRQR